MTHHTAPALTADPAGWSPDSDRAGGIVMEGVRLSRGGRAVLTDLSMTFPSGTVTAVVGRSGVGKSTLLSALNGLVPSAAGTIAMPGIGDLDDADAMREARRRTATIFQDHALIDRLPAIDNVLLGLADRRHPLSVLPWSKAQRLRAAEALHDVGLLRLASRPAAKLSGGERQRVGIARALVRAPRLLLGDEPFASVDTALAQRIGEDLRQLAERDGLTVILVLHQLELARRLAHRIVGLADGRVAFDGPAAHFDAAAENSIFHVTSWRSIWPQD